LALRGSLRPPSVVAFLEVLSRLSSGFAQTWGKTLSDFAAVLTSLVFPTSRFICLPRTRERSEGKGLLWLDTSESLHAAPRGRLCATGLSPSSERKEWADTNTQM
jgi:hypothetical protein